MASETNHNNDTTTGSAFATTFQDDAFITTDDRNNNRLHHDSDSHQVGGEQQHQRQEAGALVVPPAVVANGLPQAGATRDQQKQLQNDDNNNNNNNDNTVELVDGATISTLNAAPIATTGITNGNTLNNSQDSVDNQQATESSATANTTNTNTSKQQQQQQQQRKGSKNAGSKKGGKRHDRPQSFWYRLCQLFDQGDYPSQIEFLRSPDSGPHVSEANRMHFSRAYKKYQNGTLANCEQTRARKRKYEPLEQKVIQYWQEQQQKIVLQAQGQGHSDDDVAGEEEPNTRQEQEVTVVEQHAAPPPGEMEHDGYNNHHHHHHQNLQEPMHQQQQQQHQQHQQFFEPYHHQQHPPPPPPAEYGFPPPLLPPPLHQNHHQHNAGQSQQQPPPTFFPQPQQQQHAEPPKRKRSKTTAKNSSHSHHHKSPLAWSNLQQKAKQWAQEMGIDDGFQASAGWIDNVLKRHFKALEAQKNLAQNDNNSNNDDDPYWPTNTRTAGTSASLSSPSSSLLQRQAAMAFQVRRADQQVLLQLKELKVGDRVTVLDISQQAGDLVVAKVLSFKSSTATTATSTLPSNNNANKLASEAASQSTTTDTTGKPKSRRRKRSDTTTTLTGLGTGVVQDEQASIADEEKEEVYVTVERRRHGSTQSFPIHDVRRVVQHMAFEEDVSTMQRLLQPQLDSFMTAMSHFPKAVPKGSRVLRPLWEATTTSGGIQVDSSENHSGNHKPRSTVKLQFSDTSCAEKINLQALRSHILPMFGRDRKTRQKILTELENMSQRTKFQQEVMDKLRYAQMAHDMANDLNEMLRGFSARDRTVVYQVDYQAIDASLRGRLFSLHPAPLSVDASTKSYWPRPLTVQAMPKDLRNALVGSFARFITTDDHERMATSILCCLAEMARASNLIPSWLDYRQHAKAWHEFIQQVHAGVTLSQAQLLPHILMHGGTYDTWKQVMNEQTEMTLPASNDEAWSTLEAFVLRLMTEWRALRDVLLTLPDYEWTKLDRAALLASHDCAPAAIPSICMVRILQACERDIWTTVSHVVQAQGWTVRAKLIDGLLVEGPSQNSERLANVMSRAENVVKSRGWNLSIVEGPCFGSYSGPNHRKPLPLLQEARRAMDELQKELEPKGHPHVEEAAANDSETPQDSGNTNVGVGPPKTTTRAQPQDNNNGASADLDPAAAGTELQMFGQI